MLVVLGLLVGAVLSGRSLIRAAELRSVPTQYSQYYSAVKAFRDKYFALPGDMANATQFWGAADVPASCDGVISTDAKTCDGNGDGIIDDTVTPEPYRAWQHLANAGLIEGQYPGRNTSGLDGNSGLPAGKVGKGAWKLENLGIKSGLPGDVFDGDYGHTFIYAIFKPSMCMGCPLYASVMLAEEAWNIDSKMDDGKPATGKVVGLGRRTVCATDTGGGVPASSDLTAIYALSITTKACGLGFRQQF